MIVGKAHVVAPEQVQYGRVHITNLVQVRRVGLHAFEYSSVVCGFQEDTEG
jgi:hypothetical protein